jgi:hypothetical protein
MPFAHGPGQFAVVGQCDPEAVALHDHCVFSRPSSRRVGHAPTHLGEVPEILGHGPDGAI